MNFSKSKSKISTIAVILLLAFSALLVALPAANAHDPPRIYQMYSRVHVAPDPVGVNQQVIIVAQSNWALPGALYVNDVRQKNITMTITQPNQQTDVQHWDLAPDPGGSAFILYTPDQVGTYTVDVVYGDTLFDWNQTTTPSLSGSQAAHYGNIFLGDSSSTTFTVQADPVGTNLAVPPPTEYWTRPIEGQNWQWESISSNWLGGASAGGASISTGIGSGSRWQPDGAAPNSAHVMWTKPIEFGGLVGGDTIPAQTYYSGFSYETRFANPLIVSGVLYYRQPLGHSGSGGGFVAVDLRTGEELWRTYDWAADKAQLFDFQSPNQHGTVASILYDQIGGGFFGGPQSWRAYDGFTGQPIFNLTNVPNGYEVYDTRQRIDYVGATVEQATVALPVTRAGDIIRYVMDYDTQFDNGTLSLWSVAKAVGEVSPLYGAEGWRANGNDIDASNAFLWTVPLPNLNGPSSPQIAGVIPGDIMLGVSSSIALTYLPRTSFQDVWTAWAINLDPDREGYDVGDRLWIQNYTHPPGNITRMLTMVPLDPVNRVWTMTDFDTGQHSGYSIDNGDLLWTTDPDPTVLAEGVRPMQLYSVREGVMAYGILFISGYGGEIFAYSTNNGTLLWKFSDTSTTTYNTGIPWGLQPLHIAAMADNKVFAFAGEHSPNTPLYKGNRHFAVDIFTGEKVWDIFGWSSSGLGTAIAPVAIADGYLVFLNAYDGQIYTIGKGPSATTVIAPDLGAPLGRSVTIKGTVMDIAAGTTQNEQAARFPNGVPAVSDESMTEWMEYVYQQKPKPTSTVGVPVKLTIIDPNSNTHEMTVTSDSLGVYSLMYEPPVPGKYTVIATFEGSESYWPSQAETAFSVDEAPSPGGPIESQPPTSPTPTPTETASPSPTGSPSPSPSVSPAPFPAEVAIIAVVVVAAGIGVVSYWILRKRQ
jgi:hypothetical protein